MQAKHLADERWLVAPLHLGMAPKCQGAQALESAIARRCKGPDKAPRCSAAARGIQSQRSRRRRQREQQPQHERCSNHHHRCIDVRMPVKRQGHGNAAWGRHGADKECAASIAQPDPRARWQRHCQCAIDAARRLRARAQLADGQDLPIELQLTCHGVGKQELVVRPIRPHQREALVGFKQPGCAAAPCAVALLSSGQVPGFSIAAPALSWHTHRTARRPAGSAAAAKGLFVRHARGQRRPSTGRMRAASQAGYSVAPREIASAAPSTATSSLGFTFTGSWVI